MSHASQFPIRLIDDEGHGFDLNSKTAEKIEFHHGVHDPIRMVEETLKNPDSGVYKSNHTADHHLYYRAIGKAKPRYMVVVVDLNMNRIDTGYIDNSIKKGEKVR